MPTAITRKHRRVVDQMLRDVAAGRERVGRRIENDDDQRRASDQHAHAGTADRARDASARAASASARRRAPAGASLEADERVRRAGGGQRLAAVGSELDRCSCLRHAPATPVIAPTSSSTSVPASSNSATRLPEPEHLDASRRPRRTSGMLWLIRTTATPRSATRRIEVEHLAGLAHAEGGGRLVHEDQAFGPHHRPADRDALPLAAGQRRDRRVHVLDVGAERGEGLERLAAHLRLVQHAEPAEQAGLEQLAADEGVLGGPELGREREVLVDRLDARARARGCGEVRTSTGSPSIRMLRPRRAAITPGQDLDQGALAGAVVTDQRR